MSTDCKSALSGLNHPKGKGNKSGLMAYPPKRLVQEEVNQLANGSFLPAVVLED